MNIMPNYRSLAYLGLNQQKKVETKPEEKSDYTQTKSLNEENEPILIDDFETPL